MASHFNNIAKLEQIDISTKLIKKDINDSKSDIKSYETQIEVLKQNLEQFKNLEKFEIELEVLENLDSDIKKNKNVSKKVNEILSRITVTDKKIKSLNPILDLIPFVDSINDVDIKINRTTEKIKNIQSLITEIQNNTNTLGSFEKLTTMEQSVLSIEKNIKNVEIKEKTILTLNDIIQTIDGQTSDINKQIKIIKSNEEQLHKLMPRTCPLCGK